MNSRIGKCLFGVLRLSFVFFVFSLSLFLNDSCKAKQGIGPVPAGEPATTAAAEGPGQAKLFTLSGGVVDKEGKPLPGTQIKVSEFESGQPAEISSTNESGQFSMELLSGKYRITAGHGELSETSQELVLRYGQGMELYIDLGGPIPGGEPVPRAPVPIGEVLENVSRDKPELLGWMDKQQAEDQRIAMVILPLSDQKSLFFFGARGKGAPEIIYKLWPEKYPVDSNRIQKLIDDNGNMAFVGIHMLSDEYLVIFRHAK